MKMWITRDKVGYLTMHNIEPFWSEYKRTWTNQNVEYGALPHNWFPELTFENSPKEVEIKLL